MNNQTKVDSIRELYKLGEQYGAIHKQLLGLGSEAKLSDIRAAEAQLYSASTPLRNVGKLGTFIRTLTRKTKFDPNELNQMFQSIMAITKSAEVQQMIWDSKGQFTPQLKDALIEEIRWQQIGLAERINAQLDAIGAK